MKNKCVPLWLRIMMAMFLLGYYSANAQKYEYSIPTPDVWSFMRYGNNPVNLYTGTISVDVPVYTYKDADFEIPVSVNYASNGYIPNIQTGVLGLGWYLNAGGSITREVRGIPDDIRIVGFPYLYGYYYQHEIDGPAPTWNELNDYLNRYDVNSLTYRSGNETESDIYHFNFGSHKGTFMLGPDKTIYVFNTNEPAGEYKIDLSDFKIGKRISITTGDGFRYTFGGGNLNVLDHNISYHTILGGEMHYQEGFPKIEYSNNFPLTKIEAPNGRKVDFTYSYPAIYDIVRPFYQERVNNKINEPYSGKFPTLSAFYTYTGGERVYDIIWGGQYATRLEKIRVDDIAEIEFLYEDKLREKGRYQSNQIELTELKNLGRLSNIKITSLLTKTIRRNCVFNYIYNNNTNGNPIMFLASVVIDGTEKYEMNYYDQDGIFPYHGTIGLDHWGYYNYRNEYVDFGRPSAFVPSLDVDESANEIIKTSVRNPNFLGARKGMLQRLTYPTKGWSTYEYESHDYSKEIKRNALTECLPDLQPSRSSKEKAGGLRIHKITDYSSDNDFTTREFIYTEAIIGKDTVSSGNLLHFPRYKIAFERIAMGNLYFQSYTTYVSASNLINYSLDGTHIEYSRVLERYSNGSYCEYQYTNYRDTPDYYMGDVYPLYSELISYITFPYADNLITELDSYHHHRGKLVSKSDYNSAGIRVYKMENVYDRTPLKFAESAALRMTSWYVKRIVLSDLFISSQNETYYYPKDTISNKISFSTTTNYTYNLLGQKIKIEKSDISGRFKTCIYNDYLNDKKNRSEAETCMIAMNMIKYPFKTIQTNYNDLNRTEILNDISEYEYGVPGSSGIPKIYRIHKGNLFDTTTRYNYSTYTSVTCNKYDRYGNLQEKTDKDGVKTCMIWSYNGRYLIAEIKNATYDQVMETIGETILDAIVAKTEPTVTDMAMINRLRISLPNALVSTYTYKHLVGLLTATDPSGLVTYYEYDTSGRFKRTYFKEGAIERTIQEYEYHYQNQ